MRLVVTVNDEMNVQSIIQRLRMIEGVSVVESCEPEDGEDDAFAHLADSDLAVWLTTNGRRYDVEDLLAGTKGVKRVAVLK